MNEELKKLIREHILREGLDLNQSIEYIWNLKNSIIKDEKTN